MSIVSILSWAFSLYVGAFQLSLEDDEKEAGWKYPWSF